MKKKLLYIMPYLDEGGTESHVLELINGFNNKYDLILLAPPGPRLHEFEKFNIRYYPFTKLNHKLIKGLKEFISQLKIIKELNPDLIHIHAAHELVLLTRFIIKNTPIIFTVHGYQEKFDYLTSSFINNIISNKVITVSNEEKKILLKTGIKKKKLELIYNGISLPDNYSIENIPLKIKTLKSSNIIVGTIARLEKEKGLQYLIKTIKDIENKNVHLLIIGSGKYKEKLHIQVEKLGLREKISFTSYVENIHDYLEVMDIFILPSLKESFGLVCVEAMAHKLPVIASETGGIPEIVKDNISGFIVPIRDSSTLTAKLKTLIHDRNLRNKMGDAGYLRFINYFNIETMLNKTEDIYLRYI
jgi:L-malate glycosyltransferase